MYSEGVWVGSVDHRAPTDCHKLDSPVARSHGSSYQGLIRCRPLTCAAVDAAVVAASDAAAGSPGRTPVRMFGVHNYQEGMNESSRPPTVSEDACSSTLHTKILLLLINSTERYSIGKHNNK